MMDAQTLGSIRGLMAGGPGRFLLGMGLMTDGLKLAAGTDAPDPGPHFWRRAAHASQARRAPLKACVRWQVAPGAAPGSC